MSGWTLPVSIGLLVLYSNGRFVDGLDLLGIPFLAVRPKLFAKSQNKMELQTPNIQIVPLSASTVSALRSGSRRTPSNARVPRCAHSIQTRSATGESNAFNSNFLQTNPLNMMEVDPWGIKKEESQLHIPSWVSMSERETRHLAAMKIVLRQDLIELQQETVTGFSGRPIQVAASFPDVYGDLRMLRFLRKDRIQDPVTAAIRYRQFLQWRRENRVDEIRVLLEERLRLGDKDVFRPPVYWQVVGDCLPYRVSTTSCEEALVPIHAQLGLWDIEKLTLVELKGSEGRLLLKTLFGYWIYVFEALNYHLYDESVRTKQMVFADIHCDLKGLKLRHADATLLTQVLRRLTHTAQSYYPETTKAIHFSRPPQPFSFTWRTISRILKKGGITKFMIDQNLETGH